MNFLTSPIRAVTSVARYALGGSGLPKKLTTFKEYNAFTRYLTDPRTQYQVLIPDDVLLRFSAIPHFKAFFTYTCEALMIEKLATCEIIPEASHADYEKSINKKHRFFGSEEEFQLAGEALAHLPAMKDRSFNVKDVLNAHSNATTTVTRLYLEGRQPTDMEADVICKFIEYQVCQHFRELQLANLVIDWLNQPKDADINEQTERSKTFFLLRNVLAGSERSDVTFPSCLRIESSKKLYKLDFECQATTKAYLATPDATQLEIVKRCREVASVVQCIHSWRNVLKDPKLPEQMVNSALVRFKDLPYAAELRRCMITMFRMHAAIQLGVEVEPEMKRNNREAQDALHKVAPHLGENRELSKEEMTIDLKNARIDAFASIVDRMYSDDVIFDVVSHYLNLMFTHVRNDDVYSEEEEEEEEDGGDDQYDTGVEEEAGSESESESEEETGIYIHLMIFLFFLLFSFDVSHDERLWFHCYSWR